MRFAHPPLQHQLPYKFIERNCWAFPSWMEQYAEEVEPYHSVLGYRVSFLESNGNVLGWELYRKGS